jgi:arylformamidase
MRRAREKSHRCCGRRRAGATLDAVVGAKELPEFLRQSRLVADRRGTAGVATRYVEIADANHLAVLDVLADPANAMVQRLLALLPQP